MSAFNFGDEQAVTQALLNLAAQAGPQAIQNRANLKREDALRAEQRGQQEKDIETQRRFQAAQEVSSLLSQLDPNDPENVDAIARAQGFLTSLEINPMSLPVNPGDLGRVSGGLGQRVTQTQIANEQRIAERNQGFQRETIELQGSIQKGLQDGQLAFTADQNRLDRLQQRGIFDDGQAQELLMLELTQKFTSGERISRQDFEKAMQEAGFDFQGTQADRDRLFQTVMTEVQQKNALELQNNQAKLIGDQNAFNVFNNSLLVFAGNPNTPEAQAGINAIMSNAESYFGKGNPVLTQLHASAASLNNTKAKQELEAGNLSNILLRTQIDQGVANILLTENQVTSVELANAQQKYTFGRTSATDFFNDQTKSAADIFAAVEAGDIARYRQYKAVLQNPELYADLPGVVKAVSSLTDEEWATLDQNIQTVIDSKAGELTYNANLRDAQLKQLQQAYAANDAAMIQAAVTNLSASFDTVEQAQAWAASISNADFDRTTGVMGSASYVKNMLLNNVSSKEASRGREIANANIEHLISSITSDSASVDNFVRYAVGEGLMSEDAARRVGQAKQAMAIVGIKTNIADALSNDVQLDDAWRTNFVSAATGSGLTEADAGVLANMLQAAKARGDAGAIADLLKGTPENSERWDSEFRAAMNKLGISGNVVDILSRSYRLGADMTQVQYEIDMAKLLGGMPESMTPEQMNATRQMIDSRQQAQVDAIKLEYSDCFGSADALQRAYLPAEVRCSVPRYNEMKAKLGLVTQMSTELYDSFLGNSISSYMAIAPSGGLEITTAKIDESLKGEFVRMFPPDPTKYNVDVLYTTMYNEEYAKYSRSMVAGQQYTFPNDPNLTYNGTGAGSTVNPDSIENKNPLLNWLRNANRNFVQFVNSSGIPQAGSAYGQSNPNSTQNPNNAQGIKSAPLSTITFEPSSGKTLDFNKAFELVVGSEGGYSTDKTDKGNWTGGQVGLGEFKGTKYGVSAASYPDLDIKNLTLEQAKEIYRKNYWDKLSLDGMNPAAAYVLFDAAINSGVGGARSMMEGAVTVQDYIANRIAFYNRLAASDPNHANQLNGWMNRIKHVTDNAISLSQ